MSSPPREARSTLHLSVTLYRLLLAAYPESFRREYGAHMVQVFRDYSREVARTEGVIGLWRYWLSALGDLLVSALAERRQEEVRMSRTFWVRLGSLAGIVAGITAGIATTLALVVSVLQLLDERSPLGLALFPIQFATQRLSPVPTLLFVLALIGLQIRGGQRAGVFGWIGITLAVTGQVIGGVGSGLEAVVLNGQADGCRTPLNCNFYDPNNYLLTGYMAALLGLLIFSIGMILYGLVSLRRRVLARSNGLPLALGLLAIANGVLGFLATLVVSGTDGAGTQKVAILLSVVPLASAIAWVLLGTALWPRDDETTVAQVA